MHERKKTVICWSGGKDCCLALYRILKDKNYKAVCLLSMVSERDGRNHAHGLPLEILRAQAEALDLPLVLIDSADDYERSLTNSLTRLKGQHGIETIVFGSLYSEDDRKWNEELAKKAGLESLFPVWIQKNEAINLLEEFISLDFESVVCRASAQYFDKSWAGRILDWRFFEDIQRTESCPMGELGEYHSFVLDGPIFHHKLHISNSDVVLNSGLWSLDIKSSQLMNKN